MIKDLFLYFAAYVGRAGVLSLFQQGSSALAAYDTLKHQVEQLPQVGRIAGIDSYVFGQSFDAVKARIDQLFSTYLFVETGSLSSNTDNRGDIQDRLSLSVTIAEKMSEGKDLVEQAILSDRTLSLANQLRACLIYDSQHQPWVSQLVNGSYEMLPFVSPEFSSVGWSITFERSGADLLGVKDIVHAMRQGSIIHL